MPVVGGLASAARAPGGNRLVLGDEVLTHGAIGAFLGPSVQVTSVVSQGCRPIGNPYAVTRSETNVVYELAGKPALERLQEVAMGISEADRRLLAQYVHFGRVIDESKLDFDRGDFLVRNVLGADPELGAIMVNDNVDVGATTQFQVRDAASADEDLCQLMDRRQADAALLFTCNGRGSNLFSTPDHDADVVSDQPGRGAAGGHVLRRRAGTYRRPQLRPRLHRLGGPAFVDLTSRSILFWHLMRNRRPLSSVCWM